MKPPVDNSAEKLQEVWARLAVVCDPELDEPVTDMGFIEAVHLDPDDSVRVHFRLPTFWCAPNFAFLMANDMREAVARLPWVAGVSVTLADHCYAEQINRGVGQGHSFSQTFPDESSADLHDLRARFRQKAFQRRQELLLRHLRDSGYTPQALLRLSLAELGEIALDEPGNRHLRARYLEIRKEFAPDGGPDAPAFVTLQGQPIEAPDFADYMTALRRVRVNAEFNANLCRGLLRVRYEAEPPTQGADATDPPRLSPDLSAAHSDHYSSKT